MVIAMSIKQQVFRCYRELFRTGQKLFANDIEALHQSKLKIKEAFNAQKNLTEPSEILSQIKVAEETNDFLKEGVIQGIYSKSDNAYKLRLTEATKLHDNVPLKNVNVIDLSNYKIPDKYR